MSQNAHAQAENWFFQSQGGLSQAEVEGMAKLSFTSLNAQRFQNAFNQINSNFYNITSFRTQDQMMIELQKSYALLNSSVDVLEKDRVLVNSVVFADDVKRISTTMATLEDFFEAAETYGAAIGEAMVLADELGDDADELQELMEAEKNSYRDNVAIDEVEDLGDEADRFKRELRNAPNAHQARRFLSDNITRLHQDVGVIWRLMNSRAYGQFSGKVKAKFAGVRSAFEDLYCSELFPHHRGRRF